MKTRSVVLVHAAPGGFDKYGDPVASTSTENGLPDRYLEVTGSELIPHVPIQDVNW